MRLQLNKRQIKYHHNDYNKISYKKKFGQKFVTHCLERDSKVWEKLQYFWNEMSTIPKSIKA